LITHTRVTHLGKRDFICHHPDCDRAFGYKHLLQRHLAKAHPSTQSELGSDTSSSGDDITPKADFDIDTITGESYAKHAEEMVKSAKSLRCPYPHLQYLTVDINLLACMDSSSSRRNCDYVFSRGYDLRRHLGASHGVNLPKETVDEWVKLQKQNRSSPS
jgi:general transcription factor IIIA